VDALLSQGRLRCEVIVIDTAAWTPAVDQNKNA
jgi:hypothetical protein